ncbi:MAG: hypothetical protein M3Z09_11915 [Acidobacteriota bacterium]|nr:hypothetical protein [Acidobacteriota bacterium]
MVLRLLSINPTVAGSASIDLYVAAGAQITAQQYYVQGLAATGTATVTASSPGLDDWVATMTLTPSAFVIFPNTFTATHGGANVSLAVSAVLFDPTTLQSLSGNIRGGFSVSVPITSSDPAVGTITVSPLIFGGNQGGPSTAFMPLTTGTSVITVGTPAGFSAPGSKGQAIASVN